MPRLSPATDPPKQVEASCQPFSQTVSQSAKSIYKLCRCSVELCLLLLLFSNLACVFCRSHNGRRLTSDIWRACCNGQNAKNNGNARRIFLRSFKQTVPSKEALGRAADASIGFWVESLICGASRRLVAGNLARLQG